MTTSILRRRVAAALAWMIVAVVLAGCSGGGTTSAPRQGDARGGGGTLGPKTEQAIGVGTMGVGAAVCTVCPPAGIAIAIVGAGLTAHGAHREESGGGR